MARNRKKNEVKIIIKPDPSSRKICLLDNKSSREVLNLGFISEKLILLKMLLKPVVYEGYKYEGDELSYWTLINAFTCEIIVMPPDLERVLASENWTQLKTQASGNSRT